MIAHPRVYSEQLDPADVEAARKASFGGLAGWLLEPVYRGEYPAQQLGEYGDQVPRFDPADLARILPEIRAEMERHGYEVPAEIMATMAQENGRPDLLSEVGAASEASVWR